MFDDLQLYNYSIKSPIIKLTTEQSRYKAINGTEYWNLKKETTKPRDTWKTKGICKSYNPISKCCNLYLKILPIPMLEVLDDSDKNLSKKKLEFISQCRHKNKYRLKTLASSMTSGAIIWKKILLHNNK